MILPSAIVESVYFGWSVSFVFGVLASYSVWWLNSHYLTPRIIFSDEIVERRLKNGAAFYQGCFKNVGRREIIDVQIIARIGVKNFLGAGEWAYHSVVTNSSSVPSLKPGERRLVRLYDTRDPLEFIDKPSRSLREAIQSCASLREVLQLGTDAKITVHVFGYDSFSSARTHSQSWDYRLHKLRVGRFEGMMVMADDRPWAISRRTA